MAQAPDPPSPPQDKEDPPGPEPAVLPALLPSPLNPKGLHPVFLPRVPKTYKEDNNSPLHIACYRGAYNEALMLLLSGHDISVRNVWNETPLHQCTAQGHLEVMMMLLDAGADVNSFDHQNLTPLHQAVIHGNRDAAELLLCYGANMHNGEGIADSMSAAELVDHVPVCQVLFSNAIGRVWSLQHLCRVAIRRQLGAARRRRIKELPLPKHLLSFLCTLPIARSEQLHQNWERTKTSKAELVRKRGEARKPKQSRYASGLQAFRQH